MKRYTSLFLTAFALVLLAAASSVYLSGYADRTEQDKTLPVLTVYTTLPAEHDVIGQAQTGTGKTAAFGIPTIEKIIDASHRIQALVLTPTRELAIQIAEEFNKIGRYKHEEQSGEI